MSIALEKGERLNLTKETPNSDFFIVGLGWDPAETGQAFDLDASAVLCDTNGHAYGEPGFIFYGQLSSTCKGVTHMGDNLTGEGAGDDEQILIDLKTLDTHITSIDFFVTIYKSGERKQNFGQVKSAYIRIGTATRSTTDSTKPTLIEGQKNAAMTVVKQFDLSEDYSTNTAVKMGTLYKKDNEWRFQAVGEGMGKLEIGEIFEKYQPGVTATTH